MSAAWFLNLCFLRKHTRVQAVSFCIPADLVLIINWASLCILWNCNGFCNVTCRKAYLNKATAEVCSWVGTDIEQISLLILLCFVIFNEFTLYGVVTIEWAECAFLDLFHLWYKCLLFRHHIMVSMIDTSMFNIQNEECTCRPFAYRFLLYALQRIWVATHRILGGWEWPLCSLPGTVLLCSCWRWGLHDTLCMNIIPLLNYGHNHILQTAQWSLDKNYYNNLSRDGYSPV